MSRPFSVICPFNLQKNLKILFQYTDGDEGDLIFPLHSDLYNYKYIKSEIANLYITSFYFLTNINWRMVTLVLLELSSTTLDFHGPGSYSNRCYTVRSLQRPPFIEIVFGGSQYFSRNFRTFLRWPRRNGGLGLFTLCYFTLSKVFERLKLYTLSIFIQNLFTSVLL